MVTCPCCYFDTLQKRVAFETCYLCRWEDDGQNDFDAEKIRGGPNGDYSLLEARENFTQYLTMFRLGDSGNTQTEIEINAKRKIMSAFNELKYKAFVSKI